MVAVRYAFHLLCALGLLSLFGPDVIEMTLNESQSTTINEERVLYSFQLI